MIFPYRKRKPQRWMTVAAIVTMLLILAIIYLPGQIAPTNQSSLETTPIAKPTITIGIPKSTDTSFFIALNALEAWLEEETGHEIDFLLLDVSSASDYEYQVKTLIQDNTLPDILLDLELSQDKISHYGNDGVFVDLRALLDDKEKSKIFWERMDTLETDTYGSQADRVWQQILATNGAIYAYPSVQTSLSSGFAYMPMINQVWLTRLNLSMPTTPDELVTVLRAFRDQDPNGDGVHNDIPMLGASSGQAANMIDWLINLYIFYDSSTLMNVNANGDVYTVVTTEAYRNALKWIRSLVAENLLYTKTFSNGTGTLRDYLGVADIVGVTVGSPEIILRDYYADRWAALDLYGSCMVDPLTVSQECFISSSCDNVDAAWQILMLLSTQEGAARQMYGDLGEHWVYAEADQTTVWDMPATIQVLKSDISAFACVGFFTYNITDLTQTSSPSHIQQLIADIRQDQMAVIAQATTGQTLPWLHLNEAEKAMILDISIIQSTVKSWQTRFLTGDANIASDAAWDAYLTELNQIGLSEYINAYQQCYDRMYPNGH